MPMTPTDVDDSKPTIDSSKFSGKKGGKGGVLKAAVKGLASLSPVGAIASSILDAKGKKKGGDKDSSKGNWSSKYTGQ